MRLIISKTCCLTGHRPNKLPWGYNEDKESCKNFKNKVTKILEKLIHKGIRTFLTGMAEGFDMIATEILIALKTQYPHIKINAIIPCFNQEKLWTQKQQERYKLLLSKCDNKKIISKIYTNKCMQQRNQYMVDNSSIILACYNNTSKGGTKNTLDYANKLQLKIIVIKPKQFIKKNS